MLPDYWMERPPLEVNSRGNPRCSSYRFSTQSIGGRFLGQRSGLLLGETRLLLRRPRPSPGAVRYFDPRLDVRVVQR